jgi:flavin reductase (DIM6/NTAB) family NADH-FMN oxidoreductase RutF
MKKIENNFHLLEPQEFTVNPLTSFAQEWVLITAGTPESWNTMTAAWAGLGCIWHKPAAFVFVRYSRYTYEFMEESSHFTVSFFAPKWKTALQYCGSHSGRNVDKAAETGLMPVDLSIVGGVSSAAVGFAQADYILAARKLYSGEISPSDFTAMEIHDLYPGKDYHRMYIGEIEAILSQVTD